MYKKRIWHYALILLASTACLLAVVFVWLLADMQHAWNDVFDPAGPSSQTEAPEHVSPLDKAWDSNDWQLFLVNKNHPMNPYKPELTELRGGQAVDTRCYPDLQKMFDAMRAEGLSPMVNSSYRSREEQQQVLDDAVSEGVQEGLSEDTARRQALRTVAEPGTSEHETGLAIDITSELDSWEADTAVHSWMAQHSWEYGWVLRYPSGKEDITGIDNEPWHFRYVGIDAAKAMYENDYCLEEYLQYLQQL